MRLIPLTQGKVAQVDDADFDWLNQWKWFAVKFWNGQRWIWYASRHNADAKRKTLWMHRVIAGTPDTLWTDHKDTNGLNNQRENLRPATPGQNNANRGVQKNNRSGFKGVSFDKLFRRWRAVLYKNSRQIHLGYFSTDREAARAYDVAAKIYFGAFARLNFPKG